MVNTDSIWRTAGIVSVGLLLLAFLTAWRLQFSGLLSLSPPSSELVPDPNPDVQADAALGLYQAVFTAWAALALLIPTYVAFWFRNRSRRAWSMWLACWSAGAFVYIVHLGVSMFGSFGGDFGWMMSSTRVSAFWPGMIIAVWWPMDAILAVRYGESNGWIRTQRIAIHLIVFILFVGGSAAKGELLTVRLMGAVLFVVALASLLVWLSGKVKQGRAN